MEPNNKERAIAEVVENRCRQDGDCTYPAVLPEIIESIDFLFSPRDTLFLVSYVKERCPAPEPKRSFTSVLSNDRK